MTLPRTVADVLADHVTLEIERIDRMYCNVYVPTLQHPRALVGFIHHHLGYPVASTAVLGPIRRRSPHRSTPSPGTAGSRWCTSSRGNAKTT